MVCPNCHSTDIIAVQDQHFCISCGQMVPEAVVKAAAKVSHSKVAVAAGSAAAGSSPEPLPKPSEKTGYATIIVERHRLDQPPNSADADKQDDHKPAPGPPPTPDEQPQGDKPKLKRRSPGRPKTRLDVPAAIGGLPSGPKLTPVPPPVSQAEKQPPPARHDAKPPAGPKPDSPTPASHSHAATHPRHLSDIRPPKSAEAKSQGLKTPPVHHVGVAPLHFGAVLAFSLRSRAQPHWFALGAAGVLVLAGAAAYAAWLYLTGGFVPMADRIITGSPQLLAELAVLAALYYIGRSLSQTAIIYGLAREADHRPVTLARQFGVSVNTFGRRLGLDTGFTIFELVLFYLMGTLVLIGGSHWPINLELQIVAVFSAFLIMLYLLTALGLAKGLAGVALTLGPDKATESAKTGWRLFNHHFELVFLRFLAVAVELILMLPVAAVAAALLLAAPASLHLLIAFAIGLLALTSGGLLGAGTAAWWTALYRRLVELQPGNHDDSPLLTNHQPAEARRGPLTFVVALTTLLAAAALALPWLTFP